MAEIKKSNSLNATLRGKVITSKIHGRDETILQYRGIKFGKIPKRFARALPKDDWDGQTLDCTKFGPRCPQNAVDIDHFLRVPPGEDSEVEEEREVEDEFDCLNLVITQPYSLSGVQEGRGIPVLIWIHGGSQVVTFGSPASKCGDPFKIVADSHRLQMPIIVVSLNYRLNIFAFGDGKEVNLGLSDQQLGIGWVKRHIADFGGDVNNITLYGQSAGGVYAHANMFTVTGIKRGILSSGSLYLSPPLPRERGQAYINAITKKVKANCGNSLSDATVEVLLKALRDLNVNTQWIQEEESLSGWRGKMELVDSLMIGDVEYESVLWRNGIEQLSPEEIIAAFKTHLSPETSAKVLRLYGISSNRPTASKHGALDFLNDARYAMPVEHIVSKWRHEKKPIYRYLFDQVNPWQASSRAHHAVDLIYLFGGYDDSISQFYGRNLNSSVCEKVGVYMREMWIKFINGKEPWEGTFPVPMSYHAIGPHGDCRNIDESEFAFRRRANHMEVLRELQDSAGLDGTVGALAGGRLSFIN